ncbi:dienelactone hydrolase family protein [Salinibacterium sp. NK8237]|uniref:dienelactone hydrolase family protein n=1 Tax=Salinibacterium sp. NK8237 TaxID=2792038 RepID=UPI0018CF83B2|nr:dienelactone hydrolase family protein [Salinibacterium sp. NK8237]MBH0130729.1 dienelactone hydrolase family protein [Salinibacterium sp. NK8237]
MTAVSVPSAPVGTLNGWIRTPFTAAGMTFDCFEKGSGPGVVLIPEIPGITPEVLGLAEHLVGAGFTVVVPSPFGTPGRSNSGSYQMGVVLRLCVSSEFRAFAMNSARPITDYLRAVACDLAARTPGRGVGMIGQCFTGGFALAAAIDDSVAASVLSQPAVPFPVGRARQLDPGVSAEEFDRIAARANAGEVCALGLRFSEDALVPRARFDTIKKRLGDAFEIIQLDSSPGNPDGYDASAHSVLTKEVREDPANSAADARSRVVAFLRERIG